MRILNGVVATILALLAIAMIPRPGAGELASDPRAIRGELRFVVDLGERMFYVYRGNMIVRIHDVAVGQPQYPTRAAFLQEKLRTSSMATLLATRIRLKDRVPIHVVP